MAAKDDSTRFLSYYLTLPKTYLAELSLGSETDTLDNTGRTLRELAVPPLNEKMLRDIETRFVGEISQMPPLFSNVQVNGRRGHEAARAGESLKLKLRTVQVLSLDIAQKSSNVLHLRTTVRSGTYIRSLARDVAQAIGTCGHLSALRRVAIGYFKVSESPEISNANSVGSITQTLTDGEGLYFLEELTIDWMTAKSFYQGQKPLFREKKPDGLYRIFFDKNFLGIARLENQKLCVERIYPQMRIEALLAQSKPLR